MADLLLLGLTRSKTKEWVTAHKISLLILVKCYVDTNNDNKHSVDIKAQREFSYSMLKWIQSPDIELKELLPQVEAISEEFFQALQNKLGEIQVSGLSSLVEFFQTLDKLLESNDGEANVHKSSIIGLFLRRMILAFDKLSFSQVSNLYKILMKYCQTKENQHSSLEEDGDGGKLTKEELTCEKDDMLDEGSCVFLFGGTFSQRQAEFFIAQQASLLRNNENEALSPKEMQRQIGELLKGNAGLAEAHYLSYLNNLRINEFCNTIHELYRYSDKHAFSDNDNDSYATEIGHSFRYAALNLAGVHCRFGHIDEATAALREAITMAQEANDNVCLQHALGLLCRLQQERGDDSSYLLERSATRARELNLAYLTSLGIQNYIKEKCLSGADPASMFEYFYWSDAMNSQHGLVDLTCSCLAMQSAMWQLYGQSEMSRLCSQILLNMNHSYSSSLGRSSSPVDSEAVCVVLCHLSKLHAEQGYYNAALDVINYMKKTYPSHSQYSKLWMMVEQQISFTRAIHHAKWTAAEQAVLNIVSIDEVEALYRKCIVLRMKGETSEAYKLLNEMLIHCQHRKKGYTAEHHTRLLITLSELCCQTTNYSLAASHLLQCLSLCQQHHFYYLAAMTMMHLAQVQLLLSLPHQALSLVDKSITQVLAHGSEYDKCSVQLLLAKCQLACTKPQKTDKRKEALLSAISVLNHIAIGFQKTEVQFKLKEVLYIQAQIYGELGYSVERNKCALMFRQLDLQYPASICPPLMTL